MMRRGWQYLVTICYPAGHCILAQLRRSDMSYAFPGCDVIGSGLYYEWHWRKMR